VKGPLDMKYRIEGTTRNLQLNRIAVHAGKPDTLQLGASGRITFGSWDRTDPLDDIDLKFWADGADTHSLGTLIGQSLPELGAFKARSHVHTVAGHHRLDDFRLHTAKLAPLQVSLRGSVGKLVFVPKPALDDIQLKLAVTGDDATLLNKPFGWEKLIPAIGPVQADARISGTDHKLRINDVSISAGQPDILLVKANGSLSASNHWRPTGADIRVNVTSSDSRAFAKKLGYAFPALGPLSGQAHIHDKDNLLALDSVKLRVGEEAAP
jgi:hypothetical protein